MHTFNIVDNHLENPNDIVHVFSFSNKTINVVVKTPISSAVFLIAHINQKYIIPMYFTSQSKDGNIFTCDLTLSKQCIEYLKQHPKKVISFEVSINDTLVEGNFRGSIHPQLFDSFLKESDIIKSIQDKLIKINSDIAILQQNPSAFKESEQTLYKGMVPMATGVYNEYIWDFPYNGLQKKVLEISELALNLSTQCSKLTEHINRVESKLLDHIYEEYQL
jgi:hypothetical protein